MKPEDYIYPKPKNVPLVSEGNVEESIRGYETDIAEARQNREMLLSSIKDSEDQIVYLTRMKEKDLTGQYDSVLERELTIKKKLENVKKDMDNTVSEAEKHLEESKQETYKRRAEILKKFKGQRQ